MEKLLSRMSRRIHDEQEGITGLETAIILIAFVIVASVFAYVVLSAGLYSSQKVKQAVNAGLGSTMSTIELKGNVLAQMSDNVVQEIYLFVGIPAAGNPIDFSGTSNSTHKVIVSYSDADTLIPSVNWSLTKLSTINSDSILDENELFMLTIGLSTADNITVYDQFALELRPPDGPALVIERTVPGRVTQYINLH